MQITNDIAYSVTYIVVSTHDSHSKQSRYLTKPTSAKYFKSSLVGFFEWQMYCVDRC